MTWAWPLGGITHTWPLVGDILVCGRIARCVVQTKLSETFAVSSVCPRTKQEGPLGFNGSHVDL